MSIYEKMVAAGVEIGNHESDLYVPVNDTTTAIVADYNFKNQVESFKNNLDGKMWYDIPFAYDPKWKELAKTAEMMEKNKAKK